MITLTFLLTLIAIPIYLIVGAFVIGGSLLIDVLPFIIAIFLILFVLGLVFLPFKPLIDKYEKQLDKIGQIVGLVLFGPLVAVILLTIIAMPFFMIYASGGNPLLLLLFIVFVIIFNLIYHRKNNDQSAQ